MVALKSAFAIVYLYNNHTISEHSYIRESFVLDINLLCHLLNLVDSYVVGQRFWCSERVL